MTTTNINPAITRFILVISISTSIKAQGWCGEWWHLKTYTQEQICCKAEVFNRFDHKNQELGCCANQLYYVKHHECIDGELVLMSPLEQEHLETTRPLKEKLIDRICRKHFVYRLRNIAMTQKFRSRNDRQLTSKDDQRLKSKIWATVRVLDIRKRKQIKGTKWKTFRLIRINVPESMSRKYIGKNTMFVFSDKNLIREKSLDLSLEDVIMKDTFRRINIKRCGTT